MKRKYSPPLATEDLLGKFQQDSPPAGSENKEIKDTIGSLLSQPLPANIPLNVSLQDQEPADKIVLETIQEEPSGGQIIPPAVPFPWAKDYYGTSLHTLDYIQNQLGITTISANLECKSCGNVNNIEYNIVEKFKEISSFIEKEGPAMGGIASTHWKSLIRPLCTICHSKNCSLEQVLNEDTRLINWVFLFMTRLIGCCKLPNLKEFCEQNGIQRSWNKPKLVYLVYLNICKQLDPQGNYDL